MSNFRKSVIAPAGGLLVLLFAWWFASGARSNSDDSLSQLALGDWPPTVRVIFSPADCHLTTRDIDALNRLHTTDHLSLEGVMLEPPPSPAERRRLIASFGIEFPVRLDTTGTWQRALRNAGIRPSAILVSRRQQILAVGNRRLLTTVGVVDWIEALILPSDPSPLTEDI